MIWRLPSREIEFPRRPLVMGIINVNDDSFSGDGTLDFSEALDQAARQAEAGADVIDVGAESARTNRGPVSVDEEIRRFRGFLEAWPDRVSELRPRDEVQVWPPVISANTWRPEVVESVLPLGVELINDMGGLPDGRNAAACARFGASLLIMHSVGEPKVPHLHQQWEDVVGSMKRFFEEKMALAVESGMELERLLLDPGIDFAKQRDDNLRVFRELSELTELGRPLLVPVGRKTVIGEVLDLPEPLDRDAGTVACVATSMRRGGQVFRVHSVEGCYASLRVLASVHGSAV